MRLPRVLIDTFNTGLAQPGGIGTYAQSLAEANHCIGHQVFLLTDNSMPFDTAVNAPGHRPSTQNCGRPPWYIKNRFFSVRRLARRLSLWTEIHPVRLLKRTNVADETALVARLGYFNAIMNSPELFKRALSRFYTSRQPTLIDAPIDVDVAHFTWCLPIRVRNAANIYTLHDLIPLRFPHLTQDDTSAYHDLVSWCCDTADLIVTVSEHSRREIIDYLGIQPAKVVNTFQAIKPRDNRDLFDTDQLKSQLRSLFGLDYAAYFLIAGSIEPRKNIARAIEAHLTAKTALPLVICGGTTPFSATELALLKNPFLQRGGSAGAAKIVVLGYIPRHLLEILMAGARAVLVPSISEGFGLPALEAMSVGVPVIASDSGALPEVCGSAAIYVNPHQTSTLRDAIDQVAALAPADFAQLRNRSLLQAKQFSFETYCARLSDLYAAISA